jgi:Dehydrogenases with different specificities (related to short-chain alcohol dehydrogenases)
MIKFDLKDRVAIVTGGAQGFGFSITQRFIKSGAKVIIWDIDNKTTEDAVKKINSENCIYQIVDVKNFDQISENLKEVEKKFNKIDIFINNAGNTGSNATIAEYPVKEWKKV